MVSRCLPVCFVAVFFGLALSQSHVTVAQTDFQLPGKEVPVLRVDDYYSEAKKDRRPMLSVFSDRRVIRSVSDNKDDDYEFTLSESKFKEVLNQVFVENDFATISDETIKYEIAPRNREMKPPRTTFRVTTNTSNGSHVVDYGSSWVHDRLGLGRKRYPNAKHLQRFLKVEEVVRELAGLALIGGEKAFEETVKKANAKFKESYAHGPEISAANLFSVRRSKDGKVAVRFRIERNVVNDHPVSVWVTKMKDAKEPSVEVKVDSPRLLNDLIKRPPIQIK